MVMDVTIIRTFHLDPIPSQPEEFLHCCWGHGPKHQRAFPTSKDSDHDTVDQKTFQDTTIYSDLYRLLFHNRKKTKNIENCIYELVGGLEHQFYFPIYWESSSQLTFIFFRGVQTTNQ